MRERTFSFQPEIVERSRLRELGGKEDVAYWMTRPPAKGDMRLWSFCDNSFLIMIRLPPDFLDSLRLLNQTDSLGNRRR